MHEKSWELKAYPIGRVVAAKGNDSPRSSGIVLIACDAPQPQSYCCRRYFFWMNPSSVVRSRIQPHWVIAGLERLDVSTEEHLQQIQTHDTIIDKLNHPIYQHPRLHGLASRNFQRGRSLDSVEREVGKAGRLTWSCDVLAIEPSRLPASNGIRKSHSRKVTPFPLLDT